MLLNSALLIRFVALLLAAFIGNAFLKFSAMAEPDEFNNFTIFFGVAFGVVSQAGLVASTTKFGLRYKLLTALLRKTIRTMRTLLPSTQFADSSLDQEVVRLRKSKLDYLATYSRQEQ